MANVIQVCSNFNRAPVFTINTRPDESVKGPRCTSQTLFRDGFDQVSRLQLMRDASLAHVDVQRAGTHQESHPDEYL